MENRVLAGLLLLSPNNQLNSSQSAWFELGMNRLQSAQKYGVIWKSQHTLDEHKDFQSVLS